jgi:hypothetical protein
MTKLSQIQSLFINGHQLFDRRNEYNKYKKILMFFSHYETWEINITIIIKRAKIPSKIGNQTNKKKDKKVVGKKGDNRKKQNHH